MIEITNEIAKDIILRNVIRKQSGTKIAQELGCAQSTVNQLIRAYNLISAEDWNGLCEFAESARSALAKCRTCEDALGMSIPGAIWDRLQAAEKRGKEKLRAPEKPKTDAEDAEDAKEEKKGLPDNTAWVVSQILTKLDTLIVSMSDMQKYLIAYTEVTKANAELMLNIGESPNAAVESHLPQILEVGVPEKYYLSQKACLGILRRASARGKQLPELLQKALERQALSA